MSEPRHTDTTLVNQSVWGRRAQPFLIALLGTIALMDKILAVAFIVTCISVVAWLSSRANRLFQVTQLD